MGKDTINKIIAGQDVEKIFLDALDNIYLNGFKTPEDIETLTYVKCYQPALFTKYENKVLITLGLFYKNVKPATMIETMFDIYKKSINDVYKSNLTPIQADIVSRINDNQVFSFSSPTSTGKSYIFRKLITENTNDIVIIVPSRALINEYRNRVNKIVNDKKTLVLTYIDLINKNNTNRYIFIITPERSKELFNMRDNLNVSLIIFDEAQLGDSTSFRGLYFDSIVRRCKKYFHNSKLLFAQPFVDNPECQFIKNKIDYSTKNYKSYDYQNIGQMFYSFKNGVYRHFSIIDHENIKKDIVDPIEDALKSNGTVLIFSAKSRILDKRVMSTYKKYIDLCPVINDRDALSLIKKYKEYLGATERIDGKENRNSTMVDYLKRGIVIHHGSLPLYARYIVEDFTQKGFCKICFATSTLEQGINMPFDIVFLDKFEQSKPLAIKNLIGRAGRSTENPVFDYGKVIVKDSNKSALSDILLNRIILSNVSQLDEETDDDNKEYKEAIKNGTFNENLNLTDLEVKRLEHHKTKEIVKEILNLFFNDDFSLVFWERTSEEKTFVRQGFADIYEKSLGRELTEGERGVCREACKILIWKIMGKKFSEIVKYRFRQVCKTNQQKELLELIKKAKSFNEKKEYQDKLESLTVDYAAPFYPLPNKKISRVPLFDPSTSVYNVDYDTLILDTYDYLDKLLGFRFGDVIYAAFFKYYEEFNDKKALCMANYIRYGSSDEQEIMMIRYGFVFEDFEWLKGIILKIDEDEIVFDADKISYLDEERKAIIEKYL